MQDFWLTNKQLLELRKAHRAERNRHAAYKINAIILLGSGWKLKQVKDALLLDEETLRSYVRKYQQGGIQALIDTHYLGRNSLLTKTQQQQLCEELDSTIYLTTHSIIAFVEKTFHIKYSISGMRDLLHRLGYEFKKPKLVPGIPDKVAQEDFVNDYEAFMASKSPDIDVVFVDAVHPEHNTMAAYGWIKRGEKRCLRTNSGRQRLNLHGAINVETNELTVIESDTVNKDSTLALLETLEQKYFLSKTIFVILDNARYHYSKEVREYVAKSKRLELVYLPPYSPELNLIERVWKFFKKKVLYNKYYETLDDFRTASIKFFRNIDHYSDELSSLLSGGFEEISCT